MTKNKKDSRSASGKGMIEEETDLGRLIMQEYIR